MLAHIVLLRPRADVREADREALVAALEAAARAIPGIRRFQVGRRLRVDRDYERAMTEPFEYAAVIEFDDLGGLRTYLDHPGHEVLGTHLGAMFDAMLVYDYEMRTAGEVRELLRGGNP